MGIMLLMALMSTPLSASLEPNVAVVGCSNSSLVADAYLSYSTRDAVWNAAQGTYTLRKWATATAFTTSGPAGNTNPPFDQQSAQRGQPSAVWYPICIQAHDYSGPSVQQRKAAWRDFTTFIGLLRLRTSAPLYVTDTIGDQPYCGNDNDALQAYVVGRAVQSGVAQRSLPDIPPASAPDPNGCHFDPVLSTNVGAAASQFIDT